MRIKHGLHTGVMKILVENYFLKNKVYMTKMRIDPSSTVKKLLKHDSVYNVFLWNIL